MKNDNEIGNNSTGLQANNDIHQSITINNGVDFNKIFAESVLPYVKDAGEEIKRNMVAQADCTFGKAVNDCIKGVAENIEKEFAAENLREHISNAIKRADDNSFSEVKDPEKMKMLGKWCEDVEKISHAEKTLSSMWEGWAVELSKNCDNFNTSDFKIFMEKMQKMNATDARVLCLFNHHQMPFPLGTIKYRPFLKDKEEYVIKNLKQLGLIKRCVPPFALFLFSFCLFIGTGLISMIFDTETYKRITEIKTPFIAVMAMFGMFGTFYIYTSWNSRSSFRLTWIGKGILSFYKKNN